MRAALAGESGIGGFPWRRDDYGERVITLPGEIDGHRVRIGCDADCYAMAVVLVVYGPAEAGAR